MCTTIIQGIPVAADPVLPQAQVNRLVNDLKQAWSWEGRQVCRIELSRVGQMIEILAYEKPALQIVALNKALEE